MGGGFTTLQGKSLLCGFSAQQAKTCPNGMKRL